MRRLRLTRHLLLSMILACALVVAPSATLTASAASNSGTDSRPYPERVFADDSFWYRKLPDNTPVAANSAAIIGHLYN